MTTLTTAELERIARKVLQQEQFQEYNTNYHRKIAIAMMVAAMREALAAAEKEA